MVLAYLEEPLGTYFEYHQQESIVDRDRNRIRSFCRSPLATLFAALALVLMAGWLGCNCVDDMSIDNQNDGERDAGDLDDVDPDDDTTDPDDDTDNGPSEPVDPCEDVNCADGQLCNAGNCYEICDHDMDCADSERCTDGYCAPEDCQDIDCPDDQSCFRGICYDDCSDDDDCPGEGGITCEDGACVPLDDQCDNLECDQVTCPPDSPSTTLTGTVTIPSGEYPLPSASVYVPNDELEELTEGAACEQCEDIISGDPITQDLSNTYGEFELINVPAADEVPLVIQSGKWRRKVYIDNVEPCAENEITDPELLRLPRNQSEGNIPDIAVTTGGWDSLECLPYNLGLDDEEFTNPDGDGKVNFYSAVGGATNYASDFNNGATFPQADQWWYDLDNLMEYDIIMHSCEGSQNQSNKTSGGNAYEKFTEFVNDGGRAFTSHWENEWLEHAPELEDVTDWQGTFGGSSSAEVNTDFAPAEEMHDWMVDAGAISAGGSFSVNDARYTIGNLDESLTELWLTYTDGIPLYFAFNTPLHDDEDDQCGRVVFSDLHVGIGSGDNFPSQCNTDLTPQEEALIYMFFDLTACIAPECEPITCDDVANNCGIHPDECGGTIDCGVCCVEIDEPCESDEDCCDSLWCDDDTGLCTDRCRNAGERCSQNSDCCSEACDTSGEGEGACVPG